MTNFDGLWFSIADFYFYFDGGFSSFVGDGYLYGVEMIGSGQFLVGVLVGIVGEVLFEGSGGIAIEEMPGQSILSVFLLHCIFVN